MNINIATANFNVYFIGAKDFYLERYDLDIEAALTSYNSVLKSKIDADYTFNANFQDITINSKLYPSLDLEVRYRDGKLSHIRWFSRSISITSAAYDKLMALQPLIENRLTPQFIIKARHESIRKSRNRFVNELKRKRDYYVGLAEKFDI
jgi:hypothetical protein